MHAQLGSLFVAAVNYPSITPANKSLALWGLGVFLYADLLHNPQCASTLRPTYCVCVCVPH
jgi:hypothetical protein